MQPLFKYFIMTEYTKNIPAQVIDDSIDYGIKSVPRDSFRRIQIDDNEINEGIHDLFSEPLFSPSTDMYQEAGKLLE